MKTGKAIVAVLLLVGVVLILAVAIAFRHGYNTRAEPSRVETVLARAVRHRIIPKIDRDEENPWAGLGTPEVMKGAREHYADHCAQCHANDGSGKTEMGQNLYPKVPDMRLAATQNLSDGELYYMIRNGVPLTGMPAWGDPRLDQDDETWQLVLFIRHLPKLAPDEIKDMELYNPKGKMELDDEHEEAPVSEGGSGKPAAEHHH